MSLKSDAIVERIRVRLGKIDPANRQVLHTYKCKITSGGKVAKTWSKFSSDTCVRSSNFNILINCSVGLGEC